MRSLSLARMSMGPSNSSPCNPMKEPLPPFWEPAVARALITRPAVVLADEPTGNLDGPTGDRVFQVMLDLNEHLGTTLVVVTHDGRIAERMQRVLVLEDGQLAAR